MFLGTQVLGGPGWAGTEVAKRADLMASLGKVVSHPWADKDTLVRCLALRTHPRSSQEVHDALGHGVVQQVSKNLGKI